MNKHAFAAISIACTLATSLSSCSTSLSKEVKAVISDIDQRSVDAKKTLSQPHAQPSLIRETETLRFTSRSVPYRPSPNLPFGQTEVVMQFPGRHSMASVAELLSKATDIPVVMDKSALTDAAMYAPMGEASDRVRENRYRSMHPDLDHMHTSNYDHLNTIELNYHGSLRGLLNYVSSLAGLHWSYEKGTIYFSRIITRTIALKGLPGDLKASDSVSLSGGSGGSQSGNNSGNNSSGSAGASGMNSGSVAGGNSSVKSSFTTDFWQGLEATLINLVSSQGKLSLDLNAGVVTVTDAVRNVDRIEQVLESRTELLQRQVVLAVEVLQVDLNDSNNHGINWSMVLDKVTAASPNMLAALPAGSDVGNIGFTITRDSNNISALVQSLADFGEVSTAYSAVVTTTNRQPVPLNVTSTQSYLASTTSAAFSSGTGVTSSVGLVPGQITTGFSLMLLPVILDSGHILLHSSLNMSSLRDISAFTSGVGVGAQSIQLPNTEQFQTLQRLQIRSGDTMVISGFEKENMAITERDVVRDILPSGRGTSRNRKRTVVLITPTLADL